MHVFQDIYIYIIYIVCGNHIILVCVAGFLILKVSGAHHLTVLNGALMSCTIQLPDGSSVGVYFGMEIDCKCIATLPSSKADQCRFPCYAQFN